MIKIENTEIVGWQAAIRGMRNPLESWDKIAAIAILLRSVTAIVKNTSVRFVITLRLVLTTLV